MEEQSKFIQKTTLLCKNLMLAAGLLVALLSMISGWQTTFAQVTDWCSQPGILWCTSHEEQGFDYSLNITSGYSYNGPAVSWFVGGGGTVDRNDWGYTGVTQTYYYTSLPAIVTQATTAVPARSGEASVKKYLSLSSNRTDFSTSYVPWDKSVGVFLSRKLRGGAIDYTTAITYANGLYYSGWYYFPQVYTSTDTSNTTMMVMEFMGEIPIDQNSTRWVVPWSIHLQGTNSTSMVFRVDERSGQFNNSTENQTLIQHSGSFMNVPINRWVHLEVFYKYAPPSSTVNISYAGKERGVGNGQVIVYQDGQEIYRFDNVATQGVSSLKDNWLITSYSHATNHEPFQFYVDDSAISTIRLGAARELIRNGDFTSNGNFWRRDNPNGVYSLEDNAGLSVASTKAAKLNIITGTGNLNQPSFYQPIQGGMRPGITYTLRFTGKSTITRTTQVMIYHNGYYPGPFGANNEIEGGDNNIWTPYWYGSCGTVTLSTTVQNFVCPITVSQVVTNGVLGIRVGAYTSTVWLDNISLVENENLLRNGDFEQVAVWNFKNNTVNTIPGASYANDNTGGLSSTSALAAKVSITASGDSSSSVALWQPLSSTLESGITYTLRFSAKVKAGHTRPIRILLQRSGVADGIWTPILLDWKDGHPCGVIQLDENVKNFSCSFQSAVIEAKPIVTFHLGMIDANPNNTWNTDLWIDNVSLARSQ